MSAGYDHVDTTALARRGIRLGTSQTYLFGSHRPSTLIPLTFAAPDALTDATADVGAMLVLMASRRAGEVRLPAFLLPQ